MILYCTWRKIFILFFVCFFVHSSPSGLRSTTTKIRWGKKHLWFLVIGVANICFSVWRKTKIPKLSVTKSFPSRPKVDSNELEDQNCQHPNLWNKLLSRQLWIHFPASLRLFTWFVATELRGKPKATFSTDRSSGFPTRTLSLFCAPSDCESRGHFHLGLLRLRPQDFRRLSEVQRPKQ